MKSQISVRVSTFGLLVLPAIALTLLGCGKSTESSRIWEQLSGNGLPQKKGQITCVSISRDGRNVAWSGYGGGKDRAFAVGAESMEGVTLFHRSFQESVYAAVWAGSDLIVVAGSTVQRFDLAGHELWKFAGDETLGDVAVMLDGTVVVAGLRRINRLNASSGKLVGSFDVPHNLKIRDMAMASNEQTLIVVASGDSDHFEQVMTVLDCKSLERRDAIDLSNEKALNGLALSPDGSMAFLNRWGERSAGFIYQLPAKKKITLARDTPIDMVEGRGCCSSFSKDGAQLFVAWVGGIEEFETRSGAHLRSLPDLPKFRFINSCDFDLQHDFVVSGCFNGPTGTTEILRCSLPAGEQ